MRKASLFVVIGGLMLLAACSGGSSGGTGGGSGGGSGGSGGSGGQTLTDFCGKFVDAIASQASTCNSGPKDVWVQFLGTTLKCADLQKSVTANRATYDASHASACLSGVAAASCTNFLSSADKADCKATLSGKVAVGGTCYASVDCGADKFCSFGSGSCSGTCKAQIAAGLACAVGDSCVSGYNCVNSSCTADPAPSTLDIGATCSSSILCKSGLFCDQVTMKCAAAIKEGQTCVFGHFTCENFTTCAASNKCTRFAAAGGACGTTITGTLFEYAGCLSSYCSSTTGIGTCKAYLADAAACTGDEQCSSGSCASSKCAAACVIP